MASSFITFALLSTHTKGFEIMLNFLPEGLYGKLLPGCNAIKLNATHYFRKRCTTPILASVSITISQKKNLRAVRMEKLYSSGS